MAQIRVLTPNTAAQAMILGEGPQWLADRQELWGVDIKRPALLRHDLAGGPPVAFPMPASVGCAVPSTGGGFLVGLKTGVHRFDPASGAAPALVVAVEPDLPGNRLNDGKCDRQGRFWVGSMDDGESQPSGHFYRIDGPGRCYCWQAGFVVTNGIGWSVDGRTLYVTDSGNRTIYRAPYDPETGAPGPRTVFARVPDDAGYPDGLTVDAQDHVWSCHWDGRRITRYRPDGSVERVLSLPVQRPTSVAFGGAGLDVLYVTSARIGLADLPPDAVDGAVLAITGTGVTGVAERPSRV